MQNGLYRVEFRTPLGSGAGVVVLQDGNLRGGDSSMYYFGTYTETGNQATVDAESHRHTPGLQSVLGRDDAHLSLRGTVQGNSTQLTGSAREAPGANLQVSLSLIGPKEMTSHRQHGRSVRYRLPCSDPCGPSLVQAG